MKYLCLKCKNVLNEKPQTKKVWRDKDGNKNTWTFCPLRGCNGKVVEVDEFMVDVISILNNKGYLTKFCCGGHVDRPDFYISFEDNYAEIRESLPFEFYADSTLSNHKLIIRSNKLEGSDNLDTTMNILNNYKILINWVKELPYRI